MASAVARKDIKVKEGVDKETGKKIVKLVKESGIKVQASIMDDQVRITGKKIDDLQQAIALLRGKDFGVELKFGNYR